MVLAESVLLVAIGDGHHHPLLVMLLVVVGGLRLLTMERRDVLGRRSMVPR